MDSKSNFKDHFSSHAEIYARYRPDYPRALFEFLGGLNENRQMVWDCATGSGQAAVVLAEYFERVIATDASAGQIENAIPNPKVEYRVAPAEESGLKDGSVQLVTVAQALHWFDHQAFFKEVKRVTTPNGYFAAWSYGLTYIEPAIDEIVNHFYNDIVGPYWPEERHFIEEKYETIPFPFEKLDTPDFTMEKEWTADDLLSYLSTWSATQKYIAAESRNPIEEIANPIKQIYNGVKIVKWPLYLLLAKVN